jgi:hypothetical protein
MKTKEYIKFKELLKDKRLIKLQKAVALKAKEMGITTTEAIKKLACLGIKSKKKKHEQ